MTSLLIPRTFHQIWIGGRSLPAKFRRYQESWLQKHPGWTLRLWTDDNLPEMTNAEQFACSAVLAGKADILRYELVQKFGGVYLDVDIECIRNIEPLLEGVQAFVAREDRKLLCNAVLGGTAGHPLFEKLVADLPRAFERHQHRDGRYDSGQSGPTFLTRTVRSFVRSSPEPVRIFPPSVFFPYPWTEPWREHEPHPGAYAIHHWSYSWVDPQNIPSQSSAKTEE